jgi:radical SAM protein with 4Fe4S-binding SPASM domain
MPELHSRARICFADIEKMFVHIRDFLRRNKESSGHSIEFVWHGGEPFAQPISYWQAVLDLQHRIFSGSPTKYILQNVVQSNLTLITERHLPLLKHFRVGFSFDVVNDLRVNAAGRSTADAVEKKVEWLRSRGVPLAGIAVISRTNVDQPKAVAKYFLERRLSFRALNIYQGRDALTGARDAALSFEQNLKFFQRLGRLPEVRQALEEQIRIEPISTAQELLSKRKERPRTHSSEDKCIQKEWILAVNTNGDVYSPGDCYNTEFRYGNIFLQTLDKILLSKPRKRRIQRSRKRVREICSKCFLYRNACDGIYVSHATPEEVREFQLHKSCYFGLLAKSMLEQTSHKKKSLPKTIGQKR